MAGRGNYGMRGPGKSVVASSPMMYFVKPDQNVSAGVLTSPNNVFSVWRGPAKGGDDADTGGDIEAQYATQDFTTADYCVAQRIGVDWYITCFISGA